MTTSAGASIGFQMASWAAKMDSEGFEPSTFPLQTERATAAPRARVKIGAFGANKRYGRKSAALDHKKNCG